jgi:rRNA maturation endonuclease Nob1
MKKFERQIPNKPIQTEIFDSSVLEECREIGECEFCGEMMAVLKIVKVSEQSGNEYHLEAYWVGPEKELDYCPFCGKSQTKKKKGGES